MNASRPDAAAFVREIFGGKHERGDWDGFDLQELGVKTGVLVEVTATGPCGEGCACAEYFVEEDAPWVCYRLAPELMPAPEPTGEATP